MSQERADDRGGAQGCGRGERLATGGAGGQKHAADGEALGHLVQEDGEKDQDAQLAAHAETAHNCHTIHKRVERKADQGGAADAGGHRVRLFAEMEVRREHMLRQVHGDKAGERDVRGHVAAAAQCFRKDRQYGDRQQEPGRDAEQQLEAARAPAPAARDGKRAEHVGAGGDYGIQQGEHVSPP